MLDHSFEVLVVRHQELFSEKVVAAAQWRLESSDQLILQGPMTKKYHPITEFLENLSGGEIRGSLEFPGTGKHSGSLPAETAVRPSVFAGHPVAAHKNQEQPTV